MITRRQQNDNGYDADAMGGYRNVLCALILAAVVVWLGPPALGLGDGSVEECGDLSGLEPLELCAAPDGTIYRINSDATDVAPVDPGEEKTLVDTIVSASGEVQTAAVAVLDALKFILLAAVVGAIVIMRVRPRPA